MIILGFCFAVAGGFTMGWTCRGAWTRAKPQYDFFRRSYWGHDQAAPTEAQLQSASDDLEAWRNKRLGLDHHPSCACSDCLAEEARLAADRENSH